MYLQIPKIRNSEKDFLDIIHRMIESFYQLSCFDSSKEPELSFKLKIPFIATTEEDFHPDFIKTLCQKSGFSVIYKKKIAKII